MRLKNVPGSREAIAESEYTIKNEESMKGKWHELFGNNNPIHIEIGMGKGQFIMEMARRNPDINYIGIEKYSSVLIRAIEKREQEPLMKNLYFIRMDAEYIGNVFDKGEVAYIYLNFSDPWPKDRHAKRRLMSSVFLEKYTHILKREGLIEFKTDNRPLFDYALLEAPAAGWEIVKKTYDLHNTPDMMEGNIMTEYEEKFSRQGNPICKYIIRQDKKEDTDK